MLPSRIERATGVSGALATSVLLAVALVVTTISAVPAGADPVAWEERAVIWDSHGVPTDLGTLGFSSWGHEINDRNQVIGYFAAEDPGPFSDPVNRTFFWDKGVMVELGPLPGGYWAQPGALNSRGQVAGFSASNEYGDTHAFL